jgi:hypothetical protein
LADDNFADCCFAQYGVGGFLFLFCVGDGGWVLGGAVAAA